jgi:hypothetical protein
MCVKYITATGVVSKLPEELTTPKFLLVSGSAIDLHST